MLHFLYDGAEGVIKNLWQTELEIKQLSQGN